MDQDRAAQVCLESIWDYLKWPGADAEVVRSALQRTLREVGQEQFRAGVEAMRDAFCVCKSLPPTAVKCDMCKKAERLLTEQEKKV